MVEPAAGTPTPSGRLRLGLSIPTLAEPDVVVGLGVQAEEAGWDGVFLWEHTHGSPTMPMSVADTWVLLGALAARTARVRLGTAVTPAGRRLPQELARQTVTLDRLTGGRAVLGVGLGEPPEEHTAYGASADRRVLAERLDEALAVVDGLWSGEPFSHHGAHFRVDDAQYVPVPTQRPRVPVWASCTVPHRRPLQRAARWDGVILANVGDGGTVETLPFEVVRSAVAEIRGLRPDGGPFDVVVSHPGLPSTEVLQQLEELGATWVLATGGVDDLAEVVEDRRARHA